jgi:hypothetical protein
MLLFALAQTPVSALVMAWLQRTSLLAHTKKLSLCSVAKLAQLPSKSGCFKLI